MANSPATNLSGVTTFTIKANGTAINSELGVIAIHVFYQVNHIASAELVLSDGNISTQAFNASESDTFKPGTKISISAGYSSEEAVIFEGIIISHAIRITNSNQSTLNITCKDQAITMTMARNSQSFLKQSDSDIISTLIGNYSGLTAEKIDSISEKHAELVQFNCSDWDFLLTRAEANGLVVSNQSNSLSVTAPTIDKAPELVVTYGTDLIDFSAEIDARHQLSKVTGIGWDPSQQKILKGQAAATSISDQGNFSDSDLAKVLDINDYRLQTSGSLTQEMLESWAKGQRVKSMLAKVRGSLTFQGNAKAKINTLIQLAGVGDRFNGSHYIGGVHHQIENGQWLTTVDLGLSPMWSTEHRDLGAPPAAGWLPPVDGLQIGLVTKLDEDPESQFRIQIEIPALGDENNLVWARLASYYATQKSGNFFIPEIGDEVIIGYVNNDPSQPIVLGSLYSSQHTTPYDLTAENNTKAIVTKNQLKVEFNDEDKVITIITPGNNSITISDKGKSITLSDQNKNTITMDDSGITLDSPKDITLSAKGKINLKSTSNTSIAAQADVKVQGLNVNLEAQTGFTAKGSATAELSASGMTTIKGGLVKIN
ncbi:Phage-related baseplate assembly protein [Marinomonas spartinae]|uniref:Phage-related baseplate assembly protein n=1 Tax=Marinomonas spartinae TaxID=1792290 RepID=A0A1A8TII5_9GAMM|nr:type VI secretion system tip protein VgrG [Marinomonas spartinae]SBS31969.1 Phage-related baseplate assembly protein [Marinomonas spartinae]